MSFRSLKSAFRSVRKSPGSAAVNFVGMLAGITCFFLVALFVKDELSYDRYHEDADRIYRVVEVLGDVEEAATQPFLSGPKLKDIYPHLVENQVRLFDNYAPFVPVSIPLADGQVRSFNESRFYFTDSTLFDVFDFNLSVGDERTALINPFTAVITSATAERYFGTEDPVGKQFRILGDHAVTVTGILEEMPSNSHFRADVLVSFPTIEQIWEQDSPHMVGIMNGMAWNPVWTYLKLQDGASPAELEAHFPAFVEEHFHPAIRSIVTVYLQPLVDIRLRSTLDYEIEPTSSMLYVYVFSGVGLFVLLIACINFINMSTARSIHRAREVGIRKLAGAHRSTLIRQFLTESSVQLAASVLVAIPVTLLLLPRLNALASKEFAAGSLFDLDLMVLVLAVLLVASLASSLIPALHLSRFQPSQVLQASRFSAAGSGSSTMRKGLSIFQFALSAGLILATLSVLGQIDYLKSARLGFDDNAVLVVNTPSTGFSNAYPSVKTALLSDARVRAVTTSQHVPGSAYDTCAFLTTDEEAESYNLKCSRVHDDFLSSMNMELIAGRDFSEDYGTDVGSALIVNEAFLRSRGIDSPTDALETPMKIPTGGGGSADMEIVGVVRDYHYASLRESIDPFVLYRFSGSAFNSLGKYLVVKVERASYQQSLETVRGVWNEQFPGIPMEYFFLDEALDNQYQAEDTLASVISIIAFLSILIACLGLLAIAAFMAEQRTREIGIRKALGASVSSLFQMMTRDFVKLVMWALVVSLPLAWVVTSQWYQQFAYRAQMDWLDAIWVTVLMIGLTILTVGFHALRAARANPVEALRSS